MFQKLAAWLRSLFSGHTAPNNNLPMDPVTQVYYFPVNADGAETGEAILVDLNTDGSANLSRLPESVRSHLSFGLPDEMHQSVYNPKDGQKFLLALLRKTNGYSRFRTSNEHVV